MRKVKRVWALALTVVAVGCSAGGAAQTDTAGSDASPPTVTPTGTVLEVKLLSVGGEKFGPGELVVKRGDLITFVLESGVHNVAFPADRNPAGVKLPESSPYLQVPGQKHEWLVDLPAGEYTFHCDPHAVLGMVGKLTVQD